jgi:hypothetical protein
MKGQIKRVLAILFVFFFVATSTASASGDNDGYDFFCGNGLQIGPHGPLWHHGSQIFERLIPSIDKEVLNGNTPSIAAKC